MKFSQIYTVYFISSLFCSLAAMDNSTLKRLPEQELVEEEAKRHHADEGPPLMGQPNEAHKRFFIEDMITRTDEDIHPTGRAGVSHYLATHPMLPIITHDLRLLLSDEKYVSDEPLESALESAFCRLGYLVNSRGVGGDMNNFASYNEALDALGYFSYWYNLESSAFLYWDNPENFLTIPKKLFRNGYYVLNYVKSEIDGYWTHHSQEWMHTLNNRWVEIRNRESRDSWSKFWPLAFESQAANDIKMDFSNEVKQNGLMLAFFLAIKLPSSTQNLSVAETLSDKELILYWQSLSVAEALCKELQVDDGSEERAVLRNGFTSLAHTLISIGQGAEDYLKESLRYPIQSLGLVESLHCRPLLYPSIVHDIVSWDYKHAPVGKDFKRLILGGLPLTMKTFVRHSIVDPEKPDNLISLSSRSRLRTGLFALKRCFPHMSPDIKTVILSYLATDVLNVWLNRIEVKQYHWPNPFEYLKLLWHQKAVTSETILALLKKVKIAKLKELLSTSHDGKTPLGVYNTPLWGNDPSWANEEGLEDLVDENRNLLNPENVEDNFGEDIEESLREQFRTN